MTAISAPSALSPNLGYGGRDLTCFTVALAFHAMLLLWKGGMFTLPTPDKPENVLVSVDFVSDVPVYEQPAAAAPKQSLLSRMKTLIKGETHPKPKVDVFAQKKESTKPDALEIAKGKTQEPALVTAPTSFKPAQPNLKQNTFKIATKDVPFKIASAKDQDVLANTNAVPVVVGAKTTTSRPFQSANTPALQSKSFSKPMASESLAMGSSARADTPTLSAGSAASNTASASDAPRSGREFNGAFSNKAMSTLPRNTVAAFDSPADSAKSSGNSKTDGFNISGALKNRPIASKVFPKYEIDGRVSLRFRVDWSGKVLDGILVEVSSGSPTFDQKVVAALKEWSFSRLPGNRANEVQEGVITFTFKGV